MNELFVQIAALHPDAVLLRARDVATLGDDPECLPWVELGWDVLWPGRWLTRDYLANPEGWREDFMTVLRRHARALNTFGLLARREDAERAQLEFDEIFAEWPEALDVGQPVPASQVVRVERWSGGTHE